MICQNCNKNDANMHLKRIINGRAAEVHLCTDCARALGYGEAFSGFGLGLGGALLDILSASKGDNLASNSLACHNCGKTFEEIANDGKMGCAECYSVFYDKLKPSLNRLHGKASYEGTRPNGSYNADSYIEELKDALKNAINEQNFELAAQLRDKIQEFLKEGGAR